MTTRTRRSKPQQARDILLALLKDQEAESAKHKVAYEGAELRATSTRRAIELLDQAMLPVMEPEPSAEWMLRPGNIMEAPMAGMTTTTITPLHYGTIVDVTDGAYGFEYKPCTGIGVKETP